jgi:hypothetical protein
MSRKIPLLNENVQNERKYSDILKTHKKVLLVEKNRDRLDELVEEVLGELYKNTRRRLYVMELDFENSVKLSKLKKNVKDFLGNRSIFSTHPKLLLVRNIDLTNKNIIDVYSKIVSLNNDVLHFATTTNINNISKSVLINSHILWNKSKLPEIKDVDFYRWINNISVSLNEEDVITYLNTKLYDYDEYSDELKDFNEVVESKTTLFRDECLKLMLKISHEVS